MKIIIVGCGKIGTQIIASLTAEGHDVTAIDNNPAVIAEITNLYDAIGVCGNGADCDALKEANIESTELLAAFTDSDELNMLSCFIAKKMGAKHTIARIRNPEYNDNSLSFMRQQLDLSMSINPEQHVARELYNILRLPSAMKVETFSNKNFEIIEIKLKEDSPLDGISLMEMKKKYAYEFLVCVVQRDGEVYIPDGNFVLKSGDKIAIAATPSEFHKLFKSINLFQKQAKNVMILGASKTAFYLAKFLLATGSAVKIIELDPVRCEEFSEELPGVVMINGDGARQELLLEEGLHSMDAFVSLTGIDEENILISYLASEHKVPKIISKVNRDEFVLMAEKLGLDCIVSPRESVANIIVRYARALKNSLDSSVETLYKVMDGKAEVLEFVVGSDCTLLDTTLIDLQLKPNILIAGIVRSRKIIIPSGTDTIKSGDKVVILSAGHRIDKLSDILR